MQFESSVPDGGLARWRASCKRPSFLALSGNAVDGTSHTWGGAGAPVFWLAAATTAAARTAGSTAVCYAAAAAAAHDAAAGLLLPC